MSVCSSVYNIDGLCLLRIASVCFPLQVCEKTAQVTHEFSSQLSAQRKLTVWKWVVGCGGEGYSYTNTKSSFEVYSWSFEY